MIKFRLSPLAPPLRFAASWCWLGAEPRRTRVQVPFLRAGVVRQDPHRASRRRHRLQPHPATTATRSARRPPAP